MVALARSRAFRALRSLNIADNRISEVGKDALRGVEGLRRCAVRLR